MPEQKPQHTPTFQSYALGFALSILFTLTAFGLAYLHISTDHEVLSHTLLRYSIVLFAVIQLAVQAIFFLHLARRREQQSTLITFIFMLAIVVLIVGGSIWILNNLNNNMSPDQMAKYLHNEN